MISGTITPGNEALNVVVELDYTGDERVDGIAIPGADGQFTFYVTPGKNTVRARVVETLLVDGATVRREGAWQTKTYSGTLAPSTMAPELILEADSNGNFVGLKIDGYTSGMYVVLDLNNDGVPELSVSPVDERITESAIFSSLENYYRDYPGETPITLSGGLNQLTAWVVKNGAMQSEKIVVPLVVTTGLSTAEINLHRQLQSDHVAAYLEAREAIRRMEEASQSGGYAVETQSHHEETSEATDPVTSVDPGLSQMEIDLLNSLPQIPSFNTVFEMPDFVNDITFIETVESQERSWQQRLISQKEIAYAESLTSALVQSEAITWLLARRDELIATKQQLINRLQETSFEKSGEYEEMQAFFQAKRSSISSRYEQLNSATNDEDEKNRLLFERDLALLEIDCEEMERLYVARGRFGELMIQQIMALKSEIHGIETTCEGDIQEILNPANPGEPGTPGDGETLPDPMYQYDSLLAAIEAWKNSGNVNQLWAVYVKELIEHARERYQREADAYDLHYGKIMAAEEQLTETILQAWQQAQSDAGTVADEAWSETHEAERLFRTEIQQAKASYEMALKKNELQYQIKIKTLCHTYTPHRQ